MKKRILAWGLLSFMIATPLITHINVTKTHNDAIYTERYNASIEENTHTIVAIPQEELPTLEETTDPWEMLINQMNEDIKNIPYDFNDMDQKQEWFLAYKEVIAKYPKELHMCTIYEAYDEKTLDLLFRIVQAEVGDEYDFDEKANVVSVIFNRLNSGKYISLVDVLTAKNQFSPYWDGRYSEVIIDEKTILACEYVFLFGDTTNGCYAFKMTKQNKWYNWTWQFNDDCHHFYK